MEKQKLTKRVLITSIGKGKTEDKDGVKILKKYEETIYGIKKENGEFYMEKTSYMPLVIENTYNIDETIIIGIWNFEYKSSKKLSFSSFPLTSELLKIQ